MRVLRHMWVLTIILRPATHLRRDVHSWEIADAAMVSFSHSSRVSWRAGVLVSRAALRHSAYDAPSGATARRAERRTVVPREFMRVYFCFCTYIRKRRRVRARRVWNQESVSLTPRHPIFTHLYKVPRFVMWRNFYVECHFSFLCS